MNSILSHLNIAEKPPSKGDVIVIQRKQDDPERRILCKVKDVVNNGGGPEVILSGKNDYFIWSMYEDGKSWVWRVWNIGAVEITAITNTMNPFPRS